MELPFAESWKIKMVEPIRKSTREERERWMKEADYNLFQLKSEQVYIDCLTDSGTGAMSDRQWAAMMMGDESYAGSSSFFQLKDTIERLTGFAYVIPTHQGRAAENVLFSHLVFAGAVVPGNSHFDTTKGHIESRKAVALDCTIDEAKNTQLEIPFKGNVDAKKLEAALQQHGDKIPFIIVTITNNTAGGSISVFESHQSSLGSPRPLYRILVMSDGNNRFAMQYCEGTDIYELKAGEAIGNYVESLNKKDSDAFIGCYENVESESVNSFIESVKSCKETSSELFWRDQSREETVIKVHRTRISEDGKQMGSYGTGEVDCTDYWLVKLIGGEPKIICQYGYFGDTVSELGVYKEFKNHEKDDLVN